MDICISCSLSAVFKFLHFVISIHFDLISSARNALFSETGISASTLLPIIAVLTAATIGGLVVNVSPVTPRMSVPRNHRWIHVYWDGGFFNIIIVGRFLYQDLTRGFMDRSRENPEDFLLIGPSGQASGGLLLLGTAAQSDFGRYHKGLFYKRLLLQDSTRLAPCLLYSF